MASAAIGDNIWLHGHAVAGLYHHQSQGRHPSSRLFSRDMLVSKGSTLHLGIMGKIESKRSVQDPSPAFRKPCPILCPGSRVLPTGGV